MYLNHVQNALEDFKWPRWAKRLGWLALAILLVEGLVWLVLPFLLVFVGVGF